MYETQLQKSWNYKTLMSISLMEIEMGREKVVGGIWMDEWMDGAHKEKGWLWMRFCVACTQLFVLEWIYLFIYWLVFIFN